MAYEQYKILGISHEATPDEIKRAYYRLVRLHSPETDPETFKRIRAAYEMLSDSKAREAYDAIERNGDEVAELWAEAEELIEKECWEEAARRLRHLLILAPHALAAWNSLGLCLLSGGDCDGAVKTYRSLTAREPRVAAYWFNFGSAYHEWAGADEIGEREKLRLLHAARSCYRKAAAIEDFNPAHLLAISRAYADEDRLDDAVRITEQAAGSCAGPNEDLEALFWLCLLRVRQGLLEEIPPLVVRVAAALPENEDARRFAAMRFFSIGLVLHKAGALGPALVLYVAAQEIDSQIDQISSLIEKVRWGLSAQEECARLQTDDAVHPAIRVMAAVSVSEAFSVEGADSTPDRIELMRKVSQSLGEASPETLCASITRVRYCYPALYNIRATAYGELFKAAKATRASGGGSACFVVTATFGGPYEGEVVICRRFREQYLRPCLLGQMLIAAYEVVGPYLASWICQHPSARSWIAPALAALIRILPGSDERR
jgi:tetratricopeptide (TPR) repeat protein